MFRQRTSGNVDVPVHFRASLPSIGMASSIFKDFSPSHIKTDLDAMKPKLEPKGPKGDTLGSDVDNLTS